MARGASQDSTARAVRSLLRRSLTSQPFRLDCAEVSLASMREAPGSPWHNPPLDEDDEFAFHLRLFFWSPGFANQAHRHDEWTVTGVVHNTLTFMTYAETPSGLEVERRIRAVAGEVGYISSPCIHNVANESDRASVSLHVFSGVKSTGAAHRLSQSDGAIPTRVPETPNRHLALRSLIEVASLIESPRRLPILDRIFKLGDPAIKLAAAKAIAPLDPELGAERLYELATQCSAAVAEELRRLAERLRGRAEHPPERAGASAAEPSGAPHPAGSGHSR